MARKATLDTLDISVEEKAEETIQEEISLEKEEDLSGEERIAEGFLSKVRTWLYKPKFLIILSSVVVLLSSITGVSIWRYYGQDTKATVAQSENTISETAKPAEGKVALFGGFVVDLKDEKGNIRIVFFDIALELERLQFTEAISNRIDARNLIYTIIKRRKIEELSSPEMRDRLKTELKNELDFLFGEKLVKSVYFTRFEVI
jgi:flagellar basal body-associated protein FliL